MSNGKGGNGNPGMSKLANAINEQIMRYHDDIKSDFVVDTGKIGNDWSLKLTSFDIPIPKGDYLVCNWLTGVERTTTSNDSHSHKVTMPKLSKGDQVLAVWADEEVIVVDVIVSSSEL